MHNRGQPASIFIRTIDTFILLHFMKILNSENVFAIVSVTV